MKKNKNILIFCISLNKGGAERVVSLLIKKFYKVKNINIHLIILEDNVSYELPKSIVPIIISNKKSSIGKLIELPLIAYRLKKYIKKHKIDTVISFLYRPNYINILAKLFGSKHKTIINIRSTTSRYLNEGLLGKVNLFLIRSLFNKADLIVSNSKGVDEDLKSLMHVTAETKVIYNPVDLNYINEKKEICEDIPFDFQQNKKYIISVGRLIPLKRNADLIKAFYEIQKDDKNVELLFLGDGVLKNDLMQECKELKIDEKVHFLGNVRNPFYYLSKSTLFVMNSEVEGFPNVLVEAMACGLPVISSDCKSGPREILGNEEYGYLYPVGNIEVLISKIKTVLYSHLDFQMIRKNNLKRLEEYNIKNIIESFKNILEEDKYALI